MKSKIIKKNKINYNEEFTIKKLFADPNILEMHKNRLKTILMKDSTDEEIQKRIHSMVLKENAFNTIMEYISKKYEYDIDAEESKKISERFSKQFNMDIKKDIEKLEDISNKMIIKNLIFTDLAKDNNISISDKEANDYLEKYYKETNQPINELLNDSKKFKEIKDIILEEKITEWLLKEFKIKFDIEK